MKISSYERSCNQCHHWILEFSTGSKLMAFFSLLPLLTRNTKTVKVKSILQFPASLSWSLERTLTSKVSLQIRKVCWLKVPLGRNIYLYVISKLVSLGSVFSSVSNWALNVSTFEHEGSYKFVQRPMWHRNAEEDIVQKTAQLILGCLFRNIFKYPGCDMPRGWTE